MMKLHCFGESGNAYKAALTLELTEAEWEPVFVDFFNGATRTPAFRALNVMGEVPVLEDDFALFVPDWLDLDHVADLGGPIGRRGGQRGARGCGPAR